jgi:hypothetical protein
MSQAKSFKNLDIEAGQTAFDAGYKPGDLLSVRIIKIDQDTMRVGLDKKYASEQAPQEREVYAQAEEAAKAQKAGLWLDPHPMPPWDWRHR